MSEMFCQEYWHERGMKTFIARFHNVYGPHGTWTADAKRPPRRSAQSHRGHRQEGRKHHPLGRRSPTRSFMYIDDCVKGIDKIMHCDDLIATADQPWLQRTRFHQQLLDKVEKIAA